MVADEGGYEHFVHSIGSGTECPKQYHQRESQPGEPTPAGSALSNNGHHEPPVGLSPSQEALRFDNAGMERVE